MKSIEWLKEEVYEMMPSHSELYDHPDYTTVETVKMLDRFIGLIDQVEQPALPVIPGYVAEYIKETKDDDLFELLGELSNSTTSQNMKKEHRLYFWIKNNEQMFFKAMALGYTVEEKKYYILLPKIKRNWRYVSLRGNHDEFIDHYTDSIEDLQAFTEKEIKAVEPRYLAFAVPVEELEE